MIYYCENGEKCDSSVESLPIAVVLLKITNFFVIECKN